LGGILAYASIVFGVLALILLALGLYVDEMLAAVSLAAAIIGTIFGVMSRATKQGKTGLILCLATLYIMVQNLLG